MSNIKILIAACAAVGVGAWAPAFAGDTARNEERRDAKQSHERLVPKAAPKFTRSPVDWAKRHGFEYIGGDTGWQPAQHKYVLSGGAWVHSEECDHVRTAAAPVPTQRELDRMRQLYPGG